MLELFQTKGALMFGFLFVLVALGSYTKIVHMQLQKKELENEELKTTLKEVKAELENRLNIKEKEIEALKKVQENREKVLNAKKKVEIEKIRRGETINEDSNYIITTF